MNRSAPPIPATHLLPALMFVSGVSALVYEVLWSKHLALSFGGDIRAVSIVAATFMAGLAAGSYLFGKVADRSGHLLRLYGLLELGIAAGAVAFVPALGAANRGYLAAARFAPESPLYLGTLQLLLTILLLFVPTLCMGGTLPVACRCLARFGLSRSAGRLYGWNTAGAALGCLAAAFVLLPQLGLHLSGWLAIGGNLAVGLAALAAARPQEGGKTGNVTAERRPRKNDLLAVVALSGFCSMALEILWTRVFLLFFGTTIYSFAIILGCYLVGLAIGGVLYARRLFRLDDRHTLIAWLLVGMGAAVLLSAPCYDRLGQLVVEIHRVSADSWLSLCTLSLAVVFAVICLPTILSGALLPAAVGALHPAADSAGRSVGILLLFNTLGAMGGSLSASFLLLPQLGLLPSFRLLGALLVVTAAAYRLFRTRSAGSHPALFFPCAALALAAAFFPLEWDQKVMNSGPYVYAPRILAEGGLRSSLGRSRLLFASEGVEANVAVTQSRTGHRSLLINGKADANSASDMPTQVLLGQLPMLLHPESLDVLVIGLGSGVSAGAAASHPVRSLRIAELSPSVIRAADFFAAENRSVLADSRLTLFQGDGRHLLATQDHLYDVVISEPSNPWQSGNANLFTDEFYRLATTRLAPNGLFCQWLPSYDLSLPNLRSAVATFLASFPHAEAFWVYGDLILIGGLSPIALDELRLPRFPPTKSSEQLQELGFDSPRTLLREHYLFDQKGLRRFAHDAPLNTDRNPILEFAARDLRQLSDRASRTGERTLNALRQIQEELAP